MCGCDCCNNGDPTCFDPSKVDSWASSKAWVCGCDCGNCLSRVIDGAFYEGRRLGKQMGVQSARDAVQALPHDTYCAIRDDNYLRPCNCLRGDALAAIDALGLNTADCLCSSPNPDCQHPTCPREGK